MALLFPTLPGRGWPVTKTPVFETRIQRSDSGPELRESDFYPGGPVPVGSKTWGGMWKFSLTHEFLRGMAVVASGVTGIPAEAALLQAFYQSCRGPFLPFFFDDPQDDFVTGQAIGTGDGFTTAFQLQRYFGDPTMTTPGFTEAITAPKGATATVYFNGVVQPGGAFYTNAANGMLDFLAPPPGGVAITADFGFWFRCRFSISNLTLEEFMYLWHSVKTLDFQSALGDVTPSP